MRPQTLCWLPLALASLLSPALAQDTGEVTPKSPTSADRRLQGAPTSLDAPGATLARLPPSPRPKEEEKDPALTFGGSLDLFYVYNFNRPRSGRTAYRTFDLRTRRLQFGLLDLWVEQKREPVGFRLDLNWGPNADLQNALEPSDNDVWKHVQQAYVSLNLARKGKTYVDLGKWISPAGAEVVEAAGNVFHSQGLLFNFATPYYHLGARLFHHFSETDYLMVHLNRGWNAVGSPDHDPGFGISYVRTLAPDTTLTANYLGGEELTGRGDASFRHLLDLILTRDVGKWSYVANFNTGLQSDVLRPSGRSSTARWYGMSHVAKYALTANRSAALRLEWFRDDSGFLVGASNDLFAIALNFTQRLNPHVQFRAEYRKDLGTRGKLFETSLSERAAADQDTFGISLILQY